MKRDLYLIVESTSDYTFWQKQISVHFPKAVKRVHNLNSKNPADEFERITQDACDGNYRHIVFLIDEDASPKPDAKVVAAKEKLRVLRRNRQEIAQRVGIFGVKRCLESWLLADEDAIRQVLPKSGYSLTVTTDGIPDPKGEAKRLCRRQYGKNHGWSEVEFAKKMACKINFKRASKGSATFRAFWEDMKDFFARWR